MGVDTVLQSEFAVKFIYPFFLIFFVVFAVLEKSKLLGDDKKQINALIAAVISLIFVAAVAPKLIVGNLVLFLSVALIIIFVILLLWGFVSGSELKSGIFGENKFLAWAAGIIIVVGVFVVVSYSARIDIGGIFGKLFDSSWSGEFWSNVLFIVLIAVAIAVAIGRKAGGGK